MPLFNYHLFASNGVTHLSKSIWFDIGSYNQNKISFKVVFTNARKISLSTEINFFKRSHFIPLHLCIVSYTKQSIVRFIRCAPVLGVFSNRVLAWPVFVLTNRLRLRRRRRRTDGEFRLIKTCDLLRQFGGWRRLRRLLIILTRPLRYY